MKVARQRVKTDKYGFYHDQRYDLIWLLEKDAAVNAVGLGSGEEPCQIRSNLLHCPHNLSQYKTLVVDQRLSDMNAEFEELAQHSKFLNYIDPIQYDQHNDYVLRVTGPSIREIMALTKPASMFSSLPSRPIVFDEASGIPFTYIERIHNASNLICAFVYNANRHEGLPATGRIVLIGDFSSDPRNVWEVSERVLQFLEKYTNEDFQKLGLYRTLLFLRGELCQLNNYAMTK